MIYEIYPVSASTSDTLTYFKQLLSLAGRQAETEIVLLLLTAEKNSSSYVRLT